LYECWRITDVITSNLSFLTFRPVSVLLATEQLALVTVHTFGEFTAALILFFVVEFLHVVNFTVT